MRAKTTRNVCGFRRMNGNSRYKILLKQDLRKKSRLIILTSLKQVYFFLSPVGSAKKLFLLTNRRFTVPVCASVKYASPLSEECKIYFITESARYATTVMGAGWLLPCIFNVYTGVDDGE